MPAAAVIPAPIAYIKVVAVKKLVVEFLRGTVGPLDCASLLILSSLYGRRRPSLVRRFDVHLLL